MIFSEKSYRKVLWGSKIQQDPPTITYEEAMDESNDKGLFKWLSKVVSHLLVNQDFKQVID